MTPAVCAAHTGCGQKPVIQLINRRNISYHRFQGYSMARRLHFRPAFEVVCVRT